MREIEKIVLLAVVGGFVAMALSAYVIFYLL